MIKFLTYLAIMTLGFFPVSLQAEEYDFSSIGRYLTQLKQKIGLPSGTAIAVVKDDEILYQGYFGYADIGGGKKVDQDTAFYIASATKPFFALNMLLKEHKGEINENTTLEAMFPDLIFKDIDATKITLKHLLTHTMGIDNYPLVAVTAFTGVHDNESRHSLISASYVNPKAGLNSFAYQNVGYNIASVWVDDHDQQAWQTGFADNVFSPLETTRTSAYMSDATKYHWTVAQPYSLQNANIRQKLALEKHDQTMHAAGGMITSVKDAAKFVIAQLNGGKVDGSQVFPSDVIAKSQVIQAKVDSKYGHFKRSGYAWGWYTGDYKEKLMYHHFGGYAGSHSHISFMPGQKIGLVIFNNEDTLSPRTTMTLANAIYSILLGQESAEDILTAELENMDAMVSQLKRALAQNEEKLKSREWKLSLNKSAYAGTYIHPLLGTIEITTNQEGEIIVRWANLVSRATAFTEPDSIRVTLTGGGSVIRFGVKDKKVMSFKTSGATFERQ